MTKEELKKIIDNHQHWLRRDCEGWETMRADLHGADLQCVNLRNAELRGAFLYDANLYRANLCSADLSYADLHNANLCIANLSDADLSDADLMGTNLWGDNLNGANLCGANLPGANLWGASLRNANLNYANLIGANLRGADLRDADLCNANLYATNLCDATLYGTKNVYVPIVCPDTGSFTGFKRAGRYIVVLEIPADAKRLSATGRKCRCDKAKVVEIQNIDGTKAEVDTVPSSYDYMFLYKVGSTVEVRDFNEDRWNDCSTGIHFFINRQEAVNYF